MGCWNGTCFLTQLPIGAGEKTRLVFITESPYQEERNLAGYCYTTGMYFPRGLPVLGKYDEYGGIEDIVPSLAHECLIEHFKQDVAVVRPDPERDKYVDRASLEPEKITMAYLIERAHEGCLNIYDGHSDKKSAYDHEVFTARLKNLPIPPEPIIDDRRKLATGFVMIREDMYQAILDATIPSDRWSSKDEAFTKEKYHSCAKEYLEKLKEYEKEERAYTIAPPEEKIKKLRDAVEELIGFGGSERNRFMARISPMSGCGNLPFQRNLGDIDKFIRDKIKNGMAADDPSIVSLVGEMADFMFFTLCLDYMRKGWHPQAGSGSQGDEVSLHAQLAKAVIKHADEVAVRWGKEAKEREEWERKYKAEQKTKTKKKS